MVRESIRTHGINWLQASVITALVAFHGMTQSKLANKLGVGKSAVSKVANRLVELGCIERRRKCKDKRLHVLCPTPKAYQISPQLRALHEQLEEVLFKDFHEAVKLNFPDEP